MALKLAAEGARVVVNDLDAAPADETVADIVAAGGEAVACTGSVTAPDFAERFVQTAIERFGGLDIIVNNAGYTWDNVVQKMTDEQWQAMLDVHLTAPFRILRAAAISSGRRRARRRRPAARFPQGGEHLLDRRPRRQRRPGQLLGGQGRRRRHDATLAKEWGRYNVNVNCVAFGLIQTRLTSAPADGSATLEIEGRQIKAGVNPDLLRQVVAMVPLGRAEPRRKRPAPSPCCAIRNPTTSRANCWYAVAACASDPKGTHP